MYGRSGEQWTRCLLRVCWLFLPSGEAGEGVVFWYAGEPVCQSASSEFGESVPCPDI